MRSFIGPFIITLAVVVFIFLIRFLMQYFEEFLGKDLGIEVFAELFFYFGVNVTPQCYPLAVLMSSLFVFGNLGEHSELTAIKSAGISLLRVVRPILVFVIFLCVFVYYSNDQIVPKVNLKAYSLLYDIKRTKPGLDIKPGTFYTGLPDYAIKVTANEGDGQYLENVIIYDHTRSRGNTDVIFADHGSMETFMNDRYMKLTLYDGKSFSEQDAASSARRRHEAIHQFARTEFDTTTMVFDLSSFDMENTDERLFAQHYKMKDTETLDNDIDSMKLDMSEALLTNFENLSRYYRFHLSGTVELPEELAQEKAVLESGRWAPDSAELAQQAAAEESQAGTLDSARKAQAIADAQEMQPGDGPRRLDNRENAPAALRNVIEEDKETDAERAQRLRSTITTFDSAIISRVNILGDLPHNRPKIFKAAATSARYVKNNLNVQATKINNREARIREYRVERDKKLALAIACFVMFLIGAPLGSIIKKGGLGIPILISIGFFIYFYVFMTVGEKWGRQGLIDPLLAAWLPNLVMLPFGIFFLIQARNDSRLLDSDVYQRMLDKVRGGVKGKGRLRKPKFG